MMAPAASNGAKEVPGSSSGQGCTCNRNRPAALHMSCPYHLTFIPRGHRPMIVYQGLVSLTDVLQEKRCDLT